MAVTGELNAVRQPVPQIVHEGDRVVAIPTADQPRNQELGVGLDGRPGPRVARAGNGGFHLGDVLLLPRRKRPDFIYLQLCEGSSMRSISRVADVSINTVSKLLVDAAKACAAFHDEKVRGARPFQQLAALLFKQLQL